MPAVAGFNSSRADAYFAKNQLLPFPLAHLAFSKLGTSPHPALAVRGATHARTHQTFWSEHHRVLFFRIAIDKRFLFFVICN